MVGKVLRQGLTIATSLALAASLFFGFGLWRRSQDTKWCRDATAAAVGATQAGHVQPGVADFIEQQRSACVVQRQRQRQMLGAVWRTGGQRVAECAFQLARLQLVADQDPEERRAILEQFGFDPSTFDTGSRVDQDRFVEACRSGGHEAR